MIKKDAMAWKVYSAVEKKEGKLEDKIGAVASDLNIGYSTAMKYYIATLKKLESERELKRLSDLHHDEKLQLKISQIPLPDDTKNALKNGLGSDCTLACILKIQKQGLQKLEGLSSRSIEEIEYMLDKLNLSTE